MVIMDSLEVMSPERDNLELERVLEKQGGLLNTFHEITLQINDVAEIDNVFLEEVQTQDEKWQLYLQRLKEFNLTIENKCIEYKKEIKSQSEVKRVKSAYDV